MYFQTATYKSGSARGRDEQLLSRSEHEQVSMAIMMQRRDAGI